MSDETMSTVELEAEVPALVDAGERTSPVEREGETSKSGETSDTVIRMEARNLLGIRERRRKT